MGFRVYSLGLRVWIYRSRLGVWVQTYEFRVKGLGKRVLGQGFRVQFIASKRFIRFTVSRRYDFVYRVYG